MVLNQFLAQISASTIGGFKEFLKVSKTLPPILNALSEETVEIGVANTSLTILDRMGHCEEFIFYQKKY